jgi:hypothetical protein
LTIPENIKSALIIFTEGKLKLCLKTSIFPYRAVANIFDCFYKFLNMKEINIELKEKSSKIFEIVAQALCKITFEFEHRWTEYFQSVQDKITSLDWANINSQEQIMQIYACFFILKNFFKGISEVEDNEIKSIYDFVMTYSVKLY